MGLNWRDWLLAFSHWQIAANGQYPTAKSISSASCFVQIFPMNQWGQDAWTQYTVLYSVASIF